MKLKDLIPLKSKITVYVPATVDVNKEIDNSAQVERVARLLSECFGGATASPVRGYWVAENGALVAEKTTMVFAFCDTAAAEKYIDDVVTLCNELKHDDAEHGGGLGRWVQLLWCKHCQTARRDRAVQGAV